MEELIGHLKIKIQEDEMKFQKDNDIPERLQWSTAPE